MGGRALDILEHNSIFCVPKVLIEMLAHTNSIMFAMVLNRILWLVRAQARQFD
jgi:hypothetical protein